ncbi:hypothetical protein GW17_00028994 [Ensete ventricosum]|nr:hypothetical protein GW17_00028994 [Ensete ventricosum]
MSKNPVGCSSGVSDSHKRNNRTKYCQFHGCAKGARGASSLCIAHGGGRRCQRPGCQKGAEGRTIYCKAHGGGRRCQHLGCTKSAEGRTDYCIAHGGGRRCSHPSCTRAARGKSGLCIRHGGGKRCQIENCTKSAEGCSGLCISHGGGRRCHFHGCTKGAQGSTLFCKAHGGGKRCTVAGCTKGAEGSTPFCKGHGGGKRCSFQGGGVCPKSVHGGTPFCVAHGGGKRCAVAGCPRSARGRTSFCVRHGGGKRCKFEGCGKSAQGSTNFCKAHGGGKRCSWNQLGSKFGVGEQPCHCDKYARGKTGLCAAHGALVQDHCVHGGGMLGPPTTQYPVSVKLEKMNEVAAEEETFTKLELKKVVVVHSVLPQSGSSPYPGTWSLPLHSPSPRPLSRSTLSLYESKGSMTPRKSRLYNTMALSSPRPYYMLSCICVPFFAIDKSASATLSRSPHTSLKLVHHCLDPGPLFPTSTISVVHRFLHDNSNDSILAYSSRVPASAFSYPVLRPFDPNFASAS